MEEGIVHPLFLTNITGFWTRNQVEIYFRNISILGFNFHRTHL